MPQYELQGITVDFPHEAYDCQLEYMSKVIQALQEKKNALLESPTGTGKTLCLLCASLAWRQSVQPKKGQEGEVIIKAENMKQEDGQESHVMSKGDVTIHDKPQQTWAESMKSAAREFMDEGNSPIVYSSRTHSQLAQVMGELRNTSYKPKVAILGSRQQLCLHPAVSKLQGGGANQMCRALVTSRDCSWYNRMEPFVKRNPEVNDEPIEIEDLNNLGRQHGVCPFYLSREMSKTADIVFMPYNYLIDPKVRNGLKMINLEGSILIFDEAHNVESVCSDSASFEITAGHLGGAIEEAVQAHAIATKRQEAQASSHVQDASDQNYFQLASDFKVMKEMLTALESAIAAIDCSGPNGFTRPGTHIMQLLEKMKICNQDDLWTLIRKMDEGVDLIGKENAEAGRRKAGGQKLESLGDMLRTVADSLESTGNPNDAPPVNLYRVHVRMEKGSKKAAFNEMYPTLNYWCFMPGLAMQALSRMKVRSFLLTSGTLSPLNSFAAELKLQFPIQLENPHVIEPSQVWIGVLGVGPSGGALNSSYVNREKKEYKEDLGMAIANFSRFIPGGLLVFFPSYIVLQSCIDLWKSSQMVGRNTSSTWDKICKNKQAVIEPRESALFGQAASDFKRKLHDQEYTGAIFFAVCRGKVSEGLDFADYAGRAVVITGIPFANARDAKVRLKQEVLNEVARSNGGAKRQRNSAGVECLTGEKWYSQTAMRAVNQGMGRVIRHRRDYGAIILCDDRFAAPGNQVQLSSWLRPHVQVYENFGSANASLAKFFEEQAARVKREPRLPKKPTPVKNAAFSAIGQGQAQSSRLAGFSLSEVPAAMDASGLAQMSQLRRMTENQGSKPKPGAKLSLLSVTKEDEGKASTFLASRQKDKPLLQPKSEPGSLADSLWANMDSRQGVPRMQTTKIARPGTNPASAVSNSRLIPQKIDKQKTDKIDPKQYMNQLRDELPADAFKQINTALKAFRTRSMESEKLYEVVLGVLCQPSRRHLLRGFSAFVQKQDQENFARALRLHLAKKPALQQGKPEAKSKEAPLHRLEGKENAGIVMNKSDRHNLPSGSSGPCCICKQAPMKLPHKAKVCNHQACYNCWMQCLSRKEECPQCHKHLTTKLILQI